MCIGMPSNYAFNGGQFHKPMQKDQMQKSGFQVIYN